MATVMNFLILIELQIYIYTLLVTSDVDAKNRIRSLNEFSKINLNAIRRAGMHDDGVFNDCQLSDQEFDDEIASIDSQTNVMDHNASNDIIDSQLNSKDNDDNDDNDDDDD